jgi:hypothetical protein
VPVRFGDAPEFLISGPGNSYWNCLSHAMVAHDLSKVADCLLLCQEEKQTIFRGAKFSGWNPAYAESKHDLVMGFAYAPQVKIKREANSTSENLNRR